MVLDDGLIVDLFAGGGGASLGIEWAFGRSPDIAVNHDAEAIAMHRANHPDTVHYTEDVRKVDILKVCAGRPVAFLWLSPDCKHHSKAKGGKPVDRKIRGLAWEAVRWARTLSKAQRPKVICLENVQEFKDWGPVSKKTGRPDPLKKSFTYRRFKRELERTGYVVQDRMLRACDFGAPTTRERLFLIARCDGKPIVWPKAGHAKHGVGGLPAWRTAAECIDFSVPCPSIFLTGDDAKRFKLRIKRPLAEKSLRRIWRGIDKFVINNPRPFIVPIENFGWGKDRAHSIDEPLRTIVASQTGSTFALAAPSIVRLAHGDQDKSGKRRGKAHHAVNEPIMTVTGPGDFALSAPTIIPVAHAGGENRCHSIKQPIPTITGAHRGEHAVVSSVLIGTGGPEYAGDPRPVDQPMGTVLPTSHRALVAPVMVPRYGEREGQAPRARSVEEPAATVVPTANGDGLVAAHLVKNFDGNYQGAGAQVELPLSTITARDHNALATSHLMKLKGTCRDGQPVVEPIHTIQAGGYHYAEVRAFLIKYHASGGQWNDLLAPAPTVVANDSVGLVYVDGVPHAIVDIGMRMLRPRELYRCQGFPESYVIDPVIERLVGKNARKKIAPLTAEAQVRMCGNSVPPQFVKAIAEANYSGINVADDDLELALGSGA